MKKNMGGKSGQDGKAVNSSIGETLLISISSGDVGDDLNARAWFVFLMRSFSGASRVHSALQKSR